MDTVDGLYLGKARKPGTDGSWIVEVSDVIKGKAIREVVAVTNTRSFCPPPEKAGDHVIVLEMVEKDGSRVAVVQRLESASVYANQLRALK